MNVHETTWRPSLPPLAETAAGATRRIGVEIELIGLDVAEVAALVAEELRGDVVARGDYEHEVHGDADGVWAVELDSQQVKRLSRARDAAAEASDDPSDPEGAAPEGAVREAIARIEAAAESLFLRGAEAVVPVEVVSPPLPLPRLADVERLIARLREAGAKGTGAGLTYAFGIQLNPEMPRLDAPTITRYLQAFLCLYDWLLGRSAIDPTRRLTGYSAGFPAAYVRRVVDPSYAPELAALIDDYLADNPTRNRALDLLPLFIHLDRDRVRAVVDDPRVKPRPTLHYRLPNSEIDDPRWGVHVAWNDWLEVERLAADPPRLRQLCARYSERLARPLGGLLSDWGEEVKPWLSEGR
ncbi:MAG: amidoligase family protein [Nannocystaceae bacterium]